MNRVALITGASGGIGSAIALTLAREGYALALQYRSNRDAIDALISDLSDGAQYAMFCCDLCDPNSVTEMVRSIHMRLGKISALVHCAGIALPQMLFSDTTDDQMQSLFETDVFAVLRLTRTLLDDLRETGGSVVTISSVWGVTGASCEVLYSTAKAALIGFTKSLAKEMAPSGVRVNCIAPGFIPTRMNAHLDAAAIEDFRLNTPLERLGTPKDVALAVRYLLESSFVTGQTLSVDGGIVI